jgi:hypothetical protein
MKVGRPQKCRSIENSKDSSDFLSFCFFLIEISHKIILGKDKKGLVLSSVHGPTTHFVENDPRQMVK